MEGGGVGSKGLIWMCSLEQYKPPFIRKYGPEVINQIKPLQCNSNVLATVMFPTKNLLGTWTGSKAVFTNSKS